MSEGDALADGREPAPPPLARDRDEAAVNVRAAREIDEDTDVAGVRDGVDYGSRTLSNLIRLRPFMTYFCWLADRQLPSNVPPDQRVAQQRARDPGLFKACVRLDLTLLVVVMLFLVAAAVWTTYKTIVL